ncbi:acyl-CoA desaturase [Endozoicomonas sp. SM1973]|uniref:Acyl-CoA desaturase n=1 Tax=Spartinivicinus marinus TaxID=2994442 RepID=A0A853I3Y9_9GAMM|nr:acyl-CoA desaturase [Spartinivicinus marinus]MCX4029873.1 acyl-CoA desaturase [Spartinivicinus marinus]NYZ64884.1 acyl-CoA desaturase [Spartinivicinus marinus]
MDTNNETPRIKPSNELVNPVDGIVNWSFSKSVWLTAHGLIALIGGLFTLSLEAILVFFTTTAITLCLGHSLGMHRRLIHNSYECPKWLEYFFVHLGTLVGMAGPLGMVYSHDLRDWAQRQPNCHDYLRHGQGFLKDGWWQLHCDIHLTHPPEFQPEPALANDKVYQWMERTWMWQQLPWAILFFCIGGLPWVIWGISARIVVSVTGHWLIGYFAHNQGGRDWHLKGAAVQGHNVKFAGLITMGESWHNNHHAYPGSAILGIYKGQTDPGWWVLNRLMNIGLVWNVKLPEDMPYRPELNAISEKGLQADLVKSPKPCALMSRLSLG